MINRQSMTSTVPNLTAAGLLNYDANDRQTTEANETYDANGNTASSGSVANVYDFENKLVQRGTIAIVYDGDGNRVRKTAGGVTTKYLVDTNNLTGYAQVLDESQSGTVVRKYTYGLDLIAQTQSAGTTFYGYDGHGSVRQLTNVSGTVTDTYTYDAFGNLLERTGNTPNLYMYAGEQFDPDLGLYYNRARYLDVRQGRFWGMDSWPSDPRAPLSIHRYLYGLANPTNRKDPTGLTTLLETEEVAADQQTVMSITYVRNAKLIATVGQAAGAGNALVLGGGGASLAAKGIALTLAAAIALTTAAPFMASSSEDVMLRAGQDTESGNRPLFAFGNTTAPRAPRIGIDINPDGAGILIPKNPPEGASTFGNVEFAPLTGHFHFIRMQEVYFEEGLGVVADGSDVIPTSQQPPTHHTIFPTRPMPADEFIKKFLSLPWTYGGKK